MTDETPPPAPAAPTTPPAPAPAATTEPVQAPPAAETPEALVAREGLGEGLVSKVGEIAKAEKVSVSAAQKMLDAAAESSVSDVVRVAILLQRWRHWRVGCRSVASGVSAAC